MAITIELNELKRMLQPHKGRSMLAIVDKRTNQIVIAWQLMTDHRPRMVEANQKFLWKLTPYANPYEWEMLKVRI